LEGHEGQVEVHAFDESVARYNMHPVGPYAVHRRVVADCGEQPFVGRLPVYCFDTVDQSELTEIAYGRKRRLHIQIVIAVSATKCPLRSARYEVPATATPACRVVSGRMPRSPTARSSVSR